MRKGFTLIELLVVIAIVAILAAPAGAQEELGMYLGGGAPPDGAKDAPSVGEGEDPTAAGVTEAAAGETPPPAKTGAPTQPKAGGMPTDDKSAATPAPTPTTVEAAPVDKAGSAEVATASDAKTTRTRVRVEKGDKGDKGDRGLQGPPALAVDDDRLDRQKGPYRGDPGRQSWLYRAMIAAGFITRGEADQRYQKTPAAPKPAREGKKMSELAIAGIVLFGALVIGLAIWGLVNQIRGGGGGELEEDPILPAEQLTQLTDGAYRVRVAVSRRTPRGVARQYIATDRPNAERVAVAEIAMVADGVRGGADARLYRAIDEIARAQQLLGISVRGDTNVYLPAPVAASPDDGDDEPRPPSRRPQQEPIEETENVVAGS